MHDYLMLIILVRLYQVCRFTRDWARTHIAGKFSHHIMYVSSQRGLLAWIINLKMKNEKEKAM